MDSVLKSTGIIHIQILLIITWKKKVTDMSLACPPLIYLYSNIEFELPKGKCAKHDFLHFFPS